MADNNKNSIDNMTINTDEEYVEIKINPKIYSLDIVSSAAYAYMDRAYIILDGNPDEEIKVRLRPKKQTDLKELGYEFNEELLNFRVYTVQSEKSKIIKDAIVQRAMLTTEGQEFEDTILNSSNDNLDLDDTWDDDEQVDELEDQSFKEDPFDIAKPWSPEDSPVEEEPECESEEECSCSNNESEKKISYKDDPLGITKPWTGNE